MTSSTTTFYDQNAAGYFAATVAVDMEAVHQQFLSRLPAHARVLDAGCGSGRDSLAFLKAGFRVEAFDGSVELARMAAEHTGLPVRAKTFSQLDDQALFEGVWACSSLVHLDTVDLQDALTRLAAALKNGGWLYTSFKQGTTPYTDSKGRFFNRYTEEDATALLATVGLTVEDLWVNPHPMEPGAFWVNLLARKPAS